MGRKSGTRKKPRPRGARLAARATIVMIRPAV